MEKDEQTRDEIKGLYSTWRGSSDSFVLGQDDTEIEEACPRWYRYRLGGKGWWYTMNATGQTALAANYLHQTIPDPAVGMEALEIHMERRVCIGRVYSKTPCGRS